MVDECTIICMILTHSTYGEKNLSQLFLSYSHFSFQNDIVVMRTNSCLISFVVALAYIICMCVRVCMCEHGVMCMLVWQMNIAAQIDHSVELRI